MSATTITKNCAINIDHNLGRSAGELSACWVYFKGADGKLVGREGAAFIFTQAKKLEPMWKVIFYGGQTLERHRALYDAIRPYMTSYVKRKIRDAIITELVKDRMLNDAKPKTSSYDDFLDSKIYGMKLTGMVVEDTSPVPVNALKRK